MALPCGSSQSDTHRRVHSSRVGCSTCAAHELMPIKVRPESNGSPPPKNECSKCREMVRSSAEEGKARSQPGLGRKCFGCPFASVCVILDAGQSPSRSNMMEETSSNQIGSNTAQSPRKMERTFIYFFIVENFKYIKKQIE